MRKVEAVACKNCGTLKEPQNLVLVRELFINVGAPPPGQSTTKATLKDEAFCDSGCFTRWVEKELEDEIPF